MEYKIGERIKKLRAEIKITAKAVVKTCWQVNGCSEFETGASEPCVNDIRSFCKIFDVSAGGLVGLI